MDFEEIIENIIALPILIALWLIKLGLFVIGSAIILSILALVIGVPLILIIDQL